MADAQFMISRDHISEQELLAAFGEMKTIELVELRDAFARARPRVLDMVRKSSL
jgi:hypothetical protein